MDARIIHTRFWSDEYICSLTPKQKLLFMYLISNASVNLIGIYELSYVYIVVATGLTKQEIDSYKQKFQKDGKFVFFKEWIRIVNFEKYQSYKGEKNDAAKKKQLSSIPSEILEKVNTVSEIEDSVSPFGDTTNNQQPIINNQKSITNNQQEILDSEEVFNSLTSKFPDVDVREEIEKMKDWLASSGKRKKDYVAFARTWLRRCDKKNTKPVGTSARSSPKPDPLEKCRTCGEYKKRYEECPTCSKQTPEKVKKGRDSAEKVKKDLSKKLGWKL